MDARKKAYLNWSSGKDSALALYHTLRSEDFSVETLFSLVRAGDEKLSMHEISLDLLKRQAESIGIPLTAFPLDLEWTPKEYGAAISGQIGEFQRQGMDTAIFGDLFLADLRKSREENCRKSGIKAVFPLWNIPPKEIMAEFLRLGFKAVVTCVDNAVLPETFVGRVIDEAFTADFPKNADICGENGEYHSFVFDGPIFRRPVPFSVKGRYYRDFPDEKTGTHRYWYLELE